MSILHPKLSWRCRRGMLELDQLLGYFIKQHAHKLSEINQIQLIQLLDYSDQDLYNWLIKKMPATDQTLQPLISQILTATW